MEDGKTMLEVIGPTVEDAIEMGLDQLGLPREAVEVEVLDPGSKGVFGLGGRQARVRLTFGMIKKEAVSDTGTVQKIETERESLSLDTLTAEENQRSLQVASMVVRDLLERMHVRAKVSARYLQVPDEVEQPTVLIEIQGNDLSILIGRRSETLNALQYLTNLIVGKELGRWVPVLIDVQGYRARRERQLRILARRMAEQAIHTGRRQVLEPMPPDERRLIHLELRDHPHVTTESIGEDPNRKVTIVPKK
ncbi:MAG: RNA-binding cell elongation regulator Jag/EloR [Anaerolineales bacterium]